MIYACINTLVFLAECIFSILIYSILIRFFLNRVQPNFYNPLCQIIFYITDPIICLSRRVIPNVFQVGTIDLILAYAVLCMKLFLVSTSYALISMLNWNNFLLAALMGLILMIINLYIWLIIINSIMCWFSSSTYQSCALLEKSKKHIFR